MYKWISIDYDNFSRIQMQTSGEDKKFRDKVKSKILIIQQYCIIVLHVKKKGLLI